MTIAAGFLCRDGVLIATDSKISGNVAQYEAPKIYPVIEVGCLMALVTGAGPIMYTDMAFDALEKSFEAKRPDTINQVVNVVQEALTDLHIKHIYPNPSLPSFDLLIAVRTDKCIGLLNSSDNAVTRIRGPIGRCFAGAGEDVARFGSDLLNKNVNTVEEAKLVAAFSIAAAKKYSEGCGGQTKMWILRPDGSAIRCIRYEIEALQEHTESVFGGVYELSQWLGPGSSPQEIDSALSTLKERLEKLISVRRKVADLAAMRAKRATVRDPESTTADPSLEPPSPGSSGGSGES